MQTTHEINKIKDKYKDVNKYKTADIALAATMMLKGKKLLYLEPLNNYRNRKPDIFHFVFQDTSDREQLVLHYSTNSEELQVIPNAFRSTMKYLKEKTKNYPEME